MWSLEIKERNDILSGCNILPFTIQVTFAYFFCNALWLVATFALQAIGDTVSIKIPKLYPNGTMSKTEMLSIDPIALMFLLGFAALLIVQFLAMLYHR